MAVIQEPNDNSRHELPVVLPTVLDARDGDKKKKKRRKSNRVLSSPLGRSLQVPEILMEEMEALSLDATDQPVDEWVFPPNDNYIPSAPISIPFSPNHNSRSHPERVPHPGSGRRRKTRSIDHAIEIDLMDLTPIPLSPPRNGDYMNETFRAFTRLSEERQRQILLD